MLLNFSLVFGLLAILYENLISKEVNAFKILTSPWIVSYTLRKLDFPMHFNFLKAVLDILYDSLILVAASAFPPAYVHIFLLAD